MGIEHLDDKGAAALLGFTPKELASLPGRARAYDRGEWPEGEGVVRTRGGRPPVSEGDETKVVSIRVNEGRLEAVDDAADRMGITRSGAFREAIDLWLSRQTVRSA